MVEFLQRVVAVQMQIANWHVLAKFGRSPLQLSWQALAGIYMKRPESMDTERLSIC